MTNEHVLDEYLESAVGIGWDTCHKIYVLMDHSQMDKMREYGYDPLLEGLSPAEMKAEILKWWGESCPLRFVSAVKTVAGDPNEGFYSIVPQGEELWDRTEEAV